MQQQGGSRWSSFVEGYSVREVGSSLRKFDHMMGSCKASRKRLHSEGKAADRFRYLSRLARKPT